MDLTFRQQCRCLSGDDDLLIGVDSEDVDGGIFHGDIHSGNRHAVFEAVKADTQEFQPLQTQRPQPASASRAPKTIASSPPMTAAYAPMYFLIE